MSKHRSTEQSIETIPGLRSAEGTAGGAAGAEALAKRQRETSEDAALRAIPGKIYCARRPNPPNRRTPLLLLFPPRRSAVMEADILLYLHASPLQQKRLRQALDGGCWCGSEDE